MKDTSMLFFFCFHIFIPSCLKKRESHLEMQICSAKFSQKHFHGLEEFVIFCEIQKGELEKQKQNELFRGKIKVPRKKQHGTEN